MVLELTVEGWTQGKGIWSEWEVKKDFFVADMVVVVRKIMVVVVGVAGIT